MVGAYLIKFRVQLEILLFELLVGAKFQIATNIEVHVDNDSTNEHAQALTNHQRVMIGSSSFF